jgi:hypothetical protein
VWLPKSEGIELTQIISLYFGMIDLVDYQQTGSVSPSKEIRNFAIVPGDASRGFAHEEHDIRRFEGMLRLTPDTALDLIL